MEQNTPYKIPHNYDEYFSELRKRSKFRLLCGLLIRWKQHFKYKIAVYIARRRGATIGDGVIMPISLAKKANKNLRIGDHVSIQTDKIDLRSFVNVIIGAQTQTITTSHKIDSPCGNTSTMVLR